jgi:hypothetical protein
VSAAQTSGAYNVFKVTVAPGGGTPLHRHFPAETFYVLDGDMIAIIQPAGIEKFFDDLGVPSDGAIEPAPLTGPPDIARLIAITARHGIEML